MVYTDIARGSLRALLWEDGFLLSFPGIPLEKAFGRWDHIHLPRVLLGTLLLAGRRDYMRLPTDSLRKIFGKIGVH